MTNLTAGNYSIHIGEIWPHLLKTISKPSISKIFVLVDDNTLKFCLPVFYSRISIPCEIICVPPGEKQKNLHTCQLIWNQLFLGGADRKSLLIILGGGVLGDMGGLCASLYMRGISFILIPTTLLAQVDASVGGKLAIDYSGLKNAVGLFRDPASVYITPEFLVTLPKRELIGGFAEILKHALIQDSQWWDALKHISPENVSDQSWISIIEKAIKIKVAIVTKDPLETGLRKILNFGHTIGHAIESRFMTSTTPLLHGEAIAAGMLIESRLSVKVCGLDEKVGMEIADHMLQIYSLPVIQDDSFPDIMQIIRQDKKNERQDLHFSLLEHIGKAIPNQIVSEKEVIDSLNWYRDLIVSYKSIS